MKLRRIWQDSRCLMSETLSSPTEVAQTDWVVSGEPGVIESPFGKTLSFAGATPDYLTREHTAEYPVYNATSNYLTVMAWVYPTYIPAAISVMVLSRTDADEKNGWVFYISKTDHCAYLTLKSEELNAVSFFNTDELPLNAWSHVACTFTVDTADMNNCLGEMFTNGSNETTDVLRSLEPKVSNTDLQLAIRGTEDSPFYGGIALPMIFNGQLSDSEIYNFAHLRAY